MDRVLYRAICACACRSPAPPGDHSLIAHRSEKRAVSENATSVPEPGLLFKRQRLSGLSDHHAQRLHIRSYVTQRTEGAPA